MSSQLDALRLHTTVVADTGDFEAMKALRPTDATTNPSLILKAVQQDAYRPAGTARDHRGASTAELMDRLLVAFGQAILNIVPGACRPRSTRACPSTPAPPSSARAA